MFLGFLYLFLFGPFRNNKILFCDIYREDYETFGKSLKNTTSYIKNVIGNKLEYDTNKKIRILNNQLEWIRKNMNT